MCRGSPSGTVRRHPRLQKQAWPDRQRQAGPTTSILRHMGARTHIRGPSLSDHLERRAALARSPARPTRAPRAARVRRSRAGIGAVEADRVAEAGFDARGCAAARAAGSAAVELVERAPILDAAPMTRPIAEAGRTRAGRDARGRSRSRRLHRALGGRSRRGDRLPTVAGRTLVAMSGGVDSAAAAQLALGAGEDVIGVTLELWSDPRRTVSAAAARRRPSPARARGSSSSPSGS